MQDYSTDPFRHGIPGHGHHTSLIGDRLLSLVVRPNQVPFSRPQPSMSLITDTSVMGWGDHLGTLRSQGLQRSSCYTSISGAQCGLPSLSGLPTPSEGQVHVGSYRQHDSDLLYKAAAWSVLLSSVPGSSSLVEILHSSLDPL